MTVILAYFNYLPLFPLSIKRRHLMSVLTGSFDIGGAAVSALRCRSLLSPHLVAMGLPQKPGIQAVRGCVRDQLVLD